MCSAEHRVYWPLFCETLIWSSWNMKAENQILPGSGDQMAISPCAQQEADRDEPEQEAGGSYSSFEQFCQVGEPRWHGADQGKVKIQGMVSPLASFFFFSFLLASFLWQSAGNRATLAKRWRASQLPGHRKSWSLWAISLQFAASLRPHVIKLSLWERVKKEKTTCDLTCWFPENRTLQGAEGKGTEAGGGTEVCNKDLSFSFQEVFKPAASLRETSLEFFSLKVYGRNFKGHSVWSLSPLGFFLESSRIIQSQD